MAHCLEETAKERQLSAAVVTAFIEKTITPLRALILAESERALARRKTGGEGQASLRCHHCLRFGPAISLQACGATVYVSSPQMRKGRRRQEQCDKSFCTTCLSIVYSRTIGGGLRRGEKWRCPFCRGVCCCFNCALLRRAKRLEEMYLLQNSKVDKADIVQSNKLENDQRVMKIRAKMMPTSKNIDNDKLKLQKKQKVKVKLDMQEK